MTVLRHEYVEVRPAAITSFIHIVTCHKHLWRKHWWLLSILKLNTCLHDLCHRDGIARTALSLIPEVTCEIVTINITIVKCFGNLAVWNVLRVFILLLVLSSFLQDVLKFCISFGTKFFLRGVLICDYLV